MRVSPFDLRQHTRNVDIFSSVEPKLKSMMSKGRNGQQERTHHEKSEHRQCRDWSVKPHRESPCISRRSTGRPECIGAQNRCQAEDRLELERLVGSPGGIGMRESEANENGKSWTRPVRNSTTQKGGTGLRASEIKALQSIRRSVHERGKRLPSRQSGPGTTGGVFTIRVTAREM